MTTPLQSDELSWQPISDDTALAGAATGRERNAAYFDAVDFEALIREVRQPLVLLRSPRDGRLGLAWGGRLALGVPGAGAFPVSGTFPALYPEWLGDRSFAEAHGVRFPYVAGAMANGIASPQLVVAMAKASMLAFYGAGGLSLDEVARGLSFIQENLSAQHSWGANLIHSPHEPELEAKVTDLFLERGVRRVSASAFMKLTPNVVRYACRGLRRSGETITRSNYLFAKVSRPEVASLFVNPPPPAMLRALVDAGKLTAEEAALAAEIPLAEDITAEADSGGHTDNRPLTALLPTLIALRDTIARDRRYCRPIRIGAAGGLGTPTAVAAAFALGADYVLTGSVNQATVESGLSEAGKALLSKADFTDVVMAPSPDMFELGVKVQVLKRGTLFASRAALLFETYRKYSGLDDLPATLRQRLETEVFVQPLDLVWQQTAEFFRERSPLEVAKAETDAKHRMALVFRWYLGKSSRWAIAGTLQRKLDYQIWCGPAMGAFNRWTAGSFLADPAERTVVQIALNLMEGAAVVTRAQQLRSHGLQVPESIFHFRPRRLG